MSARAFCQDCAHQCETACARITPGRHVRWQAFERVGLAEQYAPGGSRNAAYMAWVSGEWSAWRRVYGPESRFDGDIHAEFDRWLADRHDVPLSLSESEAV